MAQLSAHFTLEEMVASESAARLGISNTPNAWELTNLRGTAVQMEKVRDALGQHPVHVDSGYRSPALNQAIGGVPNSAHCDGFAVDFIVPSFGRPVDVANALAASGIKFDQLIAEGDWIHISFDPRMRQQILTAHFNPGHGTTYTQGL